ncbi:RloB domain-containing protein [Vibrio cholerae]|uniref:RloB family protein n=2 Tax=Vibrio cholerae TaxID=666 RepID=UPI001159DEB6|nr:RloB family protein [Vibrio cholerae]TQP13295.1 RloB domain-containing protein [Vibrio cholerae]
MLLKRSSARGSDYSKKIDPIIMHVAYEGKEDEKEYFECLSSILLKRYRKMVQLVPVRKSSTKSTPQQVKDDLVTHLSNSKINLKKTTSHLGFIVIDKDHFFSGTHSRSTWKVITECKQRGISVLCSNPCFEIWLLCHYLDLTTKDQLYIETALANKKVGRNSKTFLKSEFSKLRNGSNIFSVLENIQTAYENENKLKGLSQEPDKLPPDDLMSNVGKIVKVLLDNGIPLGKK